jgi:hypothetical protein
VVEVDDEEEVDDEDEDEDAKVLGVEEKDEEDEDDAGEDGVMFLDLLLYGLGRSLGMGLGFLLLFRPLDDGDVVVSTSG